MTKTAIKKRILQPLSDRVLVKRSEAESKTPGGILLPEAAKEVPAEGIVVAVGPGRLTDSGVRVEMSVETGDRVLFSKYGGVEVKVDGEAFTVLSEQDILAIERSA